MKKGIGIVGVILGLALLSATVVWASATKRLDPGTQTCRIFDQVTLWEGREIFYNSCKNCHFTGNDKGASFIHTESKSMKGWNRVFYKKNVQCAKDGAWDHLSQEELLLVNDYLFRYAEDAYDPYDASDCG